METVNCREMTYQNSKKGVFEEYYEKIIEYIVLNIEGVCEKHCFQKIEIGLDLQAALQEQFMRITIRTLILEMKLSAQCGELSGNSDGELYRSFIERCILNDEWLKQFYENYPLLHQYVLETMQNTIDDICAIIQRYYQDRDELTYLKKECGIECERTLVSINGGHSDVHRGGKRVYYLELSNGEKIVYKPRSLVVDQKYMEFVQWVAKSIGIDYPWGDYIDKGDYGWCEWIAALPCETIEQMKRYYTRNGILLAVSYVLGSSDIHYENLIAHGEYPIIVDLEMAIGGWNNEINSYKSMAEMVCRDSVLRTGLLPMYAWNQRGEGINVGAINASGNQLVPVELPFIANPGSIHMKIEYRRPMMREGKNLAKLLNQFIEPYVFLEQIEDGFEKACRFVIDNKALAKKKIEQMRDVSVRYLARNTQEYAMILGMSYHPSCIGNEKRRRNVLENIKGTSKMEQKQFWITEQEICEMAQGDIPYFWHRAGGVDLCSGMGAVYQKFFDKPLIEAVLERIDRFRVINVEQQKRLIHSSLTIGRQGKYGDREITAELQVPADTVKSIKQAGTEIAKKIADILIEDAIWDEDKKAVNWISTMLAGYRERGCLIRAMGTYLYDGIAGVALFFAELSNVVQEEKYMAFKKTLVNQLFEYTQACVNDKEGENRNSGAFVGEASIAYVYQLLFELEKDEEYLAYMKLQCESLFHICEYDRTYDVLGGNAGAILVFLNAYDLTQEKCYLNWAVQVGEQLLESSKMNERGRCWVNPISNVALTGFAHGASGIMLALAKLAKYSGMQRFSEAACQAYDFEQSYFEAETGDWTDLRYPEEQRRQLDHEISWCHGSGGILMARQRAKEYIELGKADGFELIDQKRKVEIGKRKGRKRDYNLCHGRLGELAIMGVLDCKEYAEEQYRQVILELAQAGENIQEWLGQQECENYGFMSGICGLGYACLGGIEKIVHIIRIEITSE